MTQARYPCPCCGYLTYPESIDHSEMLFGICQVCFWENDNVQLDDPDYEGGVNSVSLNMARKNFRTFGACDSEMVDFTRPPKPEEKPN